MFVDIGCGFGGLTVRRSKRSVPASSCVHRSRLPPSPQIRLAEVFPDKRVVGIEIRDKARLLAVAIRHRRHSFPAVQRAAA